MSYSGQTYYPCKKSQFSNLVQDTTHTTGTWTDTQFGINISKNNNGSYSGLITMLQSCPATPYSAICHIKYNSVQGNGVNTSFGDPGSGEASQGLCLSNGTSTSSGVKFNFAGTLNGSATASGQPINLFGFACPYYFSNYTSPSGGGTFYQHCSTMYGAYGVWQKIHDDGANLTYYQSSDGITWVSIATESRTNNFTASYVGVGGNPYGANLNFNVVSFQCATNL